MDATRPFAHLADAEVLRSVDAIVSRSRRLTATLLAHLIEVDVRRLHVQLGYSSIFAWCVEGLGFSEDEAFKRIQTCRAAQKFPALLEVLADGRLHLTAVRLIAPHLTNDNFDELVAAATRQRCTAIEEFLARRFPSTNPVVVPTRVKALPSVVPPQPLPEATPRLLDLEPEAEGRGTNPTFELEEAPPGQVAAGKQPALGQVPEPAAAPAPPRYLLQVAIDKETHDKLRRAQALLAHSVPAGDIAGVLDRALDALLRQVEKRKFARLEDRPAKARRERTRKNGRRTIPAPVRRAVWSRDGGRCTYSSNSGKRCNAQHRLEFDHVVPVARGGLATVDNTRLRCRSHNQYEAERVFGSDFMSEKRNAARERRTAEGSAPTEARPGGT